MDVMRPLPRAVLLVHPGPYHPFQLGFTLVEVLVVVAILMALMMVGVPNLRSFLSDGQAQSYSESVAQGLQIARAQAIARGKHMVFRMNADNGWTAQCETMVDTGVAGVEDAPDDCIFSKTAVAGSITSPPSNMSAITFGASGLLSTSIFSTGIAPPSNYPLSILQAGSLATCALPCSVTFGGTGMVIPNAGSTPSLAQLNLVAPVSTVKSLRINIATAGQISQCDPNAAAGSKTAC